MKQYIFLVVLVVTVICLPENCGAWGSEKKVKLKDIDTLTFYQGQKTNSRRSRSVPQLKCVGGTAGCESFMPRVVQCYNKGSDGSDVQWECKTDMDNEYRFGHIEVTCEGYDYPDDPYVLKGSCGLEYTLDLTKAGHQKQQTGGQDYYRDRSGFGTQYHSEKTKSSGLGDIITLAIICIIIYALYKTCLTGSHAGQSGDDRYPGDSPYPQRPSWFGSFFGGGGGGYGSGPAPGFRPEFMPDDASCGADTRRSSGGAGNFWTGAATGGILGYILGSRNNDSRSYSSRHSRYSDHHAFGGTGSSSYSDAGSSTSSGTRTASGFGGTRRR